MNYSINKLYSFVFWVISVLPVCSYAQAKTKIAVFSPKTSSNITSSKIPKDVQLGFELALSRCRKLAVRYNEEWSDASSFTRMRAIENEVENLINKPGSKINAKNEFDIRLVVSSTIERLEYTDGQYKLVYRIIDLETAIQEYLGEVFFQSSDLDKSSILADLILSSLKKNDTFCSVAPKNREDIYAIIVDNYNLQGNTAQIDSLQRDSQNKSVYWEEYMFFFLERTHNAANFYSKGAKNPSNFQKCIKIIVNNLGMLKVGYDNIIPLIDKSQRQTTSNRMKDVEELLEKYKKLIDKSSKT